MRDLTNAIIRFSWTVPLFGMKQMLDALTCQSCSGKGAGNTTDALNSVSEAARSCLSGTMEQTANAFERTQRAVTDVLFRGRSSSEAYGSAREATSSPQGPENQGWGPIPPAG